MSIVENTWKKINVSLPENGVRSILKSEMHFMKSIDIGYIIGELDFETDDNIEYDIEFDISDVSKYNFSKSEITIFATKNTDSVSCICLSYENGKLKGVSYPFEANSKYEMNIQMVLMIKPSSLQ